MSKVEKVLKKTELFGYPISDLIGILLMTVPVAISIFWRREKNIFEKVWAFVSKQDTYYSIAPKGIIPLIVCALFMALVVRYNFFKKDGLFDIIVSSIRAFLDIWALSSFLMIFFPQRSKAEIELLLLVVLFTWLGMKSIAGYGWIILIISGIGNASKILNMLGYLWPVYIITITISLLLQVSNVADIRDFKQEFSGKTAKIPNIIREDINVAAGDAKERIGDLKETVTALKDTEILLDPPENDE